jgi:hypothetical protein
MAPRTFGPLNRFDPHVRDPGAERGQARGHRGQARAGEALGVLAHALQQSRLRLEQDLDGPAARPQALGGALAPAVSGQDLRVQTGPGHRLQQPQRSFLAARHRRLEQQR